jgi:hypothetical protein
MEQHKPHKNLLLTQVLRVHNQFRKLCYASLRLYITGIKSTGLYHAVFFVVLLF